MKGLTGIVVLALAGWSLFAPAAAAGGKWEYRAANLDVDEDEATRRINLLASDGWEYVGPLTKGMVLFRRPNAWISAAAAKEMDLFLGSWIVSSARTNGEVDADEKGATWVIKSGQLKILNSGGGDDERLYELRLDPTRKVKALDLGRPGRGAPLLGIYEFDGDNLRIAIGDAFNRPTEFTDRDQSLLVLRRRK